MYPNKTLTVGDLRKAIDGLREETPILYAWTWNSPSDLCLGGYMGSDNRCLLLDGNKGNWEKGFHNKVLWDDTPDEQKIPHKFEMANLDYPNYCRICGHKKDWAAHVEDK